MTFLSARRTAACIASVAAVAAVAVPATASAKKGPETDRGEQCSGANIVGRGSTFQDPAQLVWQPGFNSNAKKEGCSGTQGSKGKPKAEYRNTESADRGSGACLKAFGAEKHAVETNVYSFCGTDEAPNATQKAEIESHKTGGESDALETIPVVQGAVAVIVHLPEGCKASSDASIDGKAAKAAGRLVFNNATVQGIFAGTIKTWNEAISAQAGDGDDSLTCAKAEEAGDTITPVVRTDHSGTTHIFKAYLSLVNTAPIEMEKYEEAYDGSSTGCGKTYEPESLKWSEVDEACPNQRWPLAAHVARNTETGNPGVIKLFNSTPSVAGEENAKKEKLTASGGENKKGEQNTRFWAPIQNTATAGASYAEPSSKGDTAKAAKDTASNCKDTDYVEGEGNEFPPESTRALWNEAKAALVEEHYSICGLTYDLAFREYKPFIQSFVSEAEGIARATTVENYLDFEISAGGKELKGHGYEALPKEVIKEAEAGIEEIGYAKA